MAKQLNQMQVNLTFSANTAQAKAQIQALQMELTKLTSMSTIGSFNNADMEKAIAAAKNLQTHLNNAVNVDTGKLDLSRFSNSLKKSNQSLETLRNDLSLAGAQGDQVFLQLARSISQAEAPTIRLSNTLREMGNTLKNTIRWQLSSSLLHGFMGAVQQAYGYAQDLDKSLTDIRIVTGQSTDEMAKFAENANKAAKALSTTTTAYTNAALIYYQQGDSNDVVLEKTDVTTKMANVTGTSAEEVSNQLTAIWNNFNKAGEESYEKYADVLTALGAATASSTDEIAGGLEKFASIADMIGLSYDYAATALATITATTRQSEDVVGTALKTIFARIQGLSLGETLDDGTNLNKYSEALQKIGISIYDQNGQLKDMDNILNEMGSKWGSLAKDQQVALAQTVAGVRQYNQLVSLMDNWDYFNQNLEIAKNAEGTLDSQATIYAQSWEAASKRVQAATEDVFDSLIDDEFFISLTNGVGSFINGIGDIIDALGGMKGIITFIGSIFLTQFSKEIPGAIQKLTENFNVFTGRAQKDAIKMMEQNQKALTGFTSDNMTNALDAELAALTKVNEMKTSLAKTSHLLTEAERQQFEQEIQMVEAAGQLVTKEGEKVDATEKEIETNARRLAQTTAQANTEAGDGSNFNAGQDQAKKIQEKLKGLKEVTQTYVSCEQTVKRLKEADQTWLSSGQVSAKAMKKDLKVLQQSFAETVKKGPKSLQDAASGISEEFEKELKEAGDDVEKLRAVYNKFSKKITETLDNTVFDQLDKEIKELEDELRNDFKVDNEALTNLENQFREGAISADEYRQKLLALQNTEGQSVIHATKMSETIGFLGAKMMQVSMAANTLKQAWNIWSDEDATLGEKILTTMTALGTVIPLVTAVTNADNATQMASHAINMLKLVGLGKSALAQKIAAIAGLELAAAETTQTGAVIANTAAWASNPIGWIAFAIMGVIAAITLLIALIVKLTGLLIKGKKIQTENCDVIIETTKATKELTDANEELADGMDDLIEKYKTMNAEGENTSEVLAEIQSKMPDLIKSYQELSDKMHLNLDGDIKELQNLANIAKFSGNYNDFEKKKQEIDDVVAIGSAESASSGAIAANTVLAAKMQSEQGKVKGSSYKLHVGGAGAGETTAVNILDEEMGSFAQNKTGQGIDLKIDDYTDPVQMVEYYEKMVSARNRMLKEMDKTELSKSDTFREINEMISATTSEYQTAKEQATAYLDTVGKAMEAQMRNPANLEGLGIQGEVDTMQEFLSYKEQYIKLAKEQYGLSEEQAIAQFKEIDSLKRMNSEYDLASNMLKNFSGLTEKQIENLEKTDPTRLKEMTDEIAKSLTASFGQLSGTELEMAVSIAANAESIEDFSRQMQQAMIEASRISSQESAQIAATAMQNSVETGNFNFNALLLNDNFLEYLEQTNTSVEALTAESYERQYQIVSDFYAKCSTETFDSYTAQQELYYQQIADMQTELTAYHAAVSAGSAKAINEAQAGYQSLKDQLAATDDKTEIERINSEMQKMAELFEQQYHFNIESNAIELQNEIDKLLESIEELQDQKIEMAMDWSGVDSIEEGMKQAAKFAAVIGKEAKKTGNNYQLTAAQAKEWLKFYPELGEIAETTADGIIELNAKEVDEFIAGKEESIDKSIEAKIIELESQKAVLEEELKGKTKELEAAKKLAEGKMLLEDVSAQYLSDLRTNLTGYFMDLGLDEVAANKAALETMGLNEEEYSTLVADACQTNAENMTYAAEDGANAQGNALTQIVGRWQNFGKYLIENIGPLLLEIGAAILDPTKSVADVMKGAWDASAITVDTSGAHSYSSSNGDYTFNAGDPSELTAARKAVEQAQLDDINSIIAELEEGIGSLDGKIDYLKGLQGQDLSDFGETDIDDIEDLGEALKDISERYHEITREIAAQEHALEKLSRAKDRAFGGDKLNYIAQEIEGYKNLQTEQNNLYLLRLADLELDKLNLQKQFNNGVQFNDKNEIINFTVLYDASSEEQKKALEEYEKTLDSLRDQEMVLEDITDTLQELHYEKLTYKLELELEINDEALKELEYKLKQMENNFFKMAEMATLTYSNRTLIEDSYGDLTTFESALKADYSVGKISQSQYIEGLQNIRDNVYGLVDGLMELDDTMMHYYGDTLTAGAEKLSMYTAEMDQLVSVLDHYMNLADILGKSKDYEMMGNFLQGKADIIADELAIATKDYDYLAAKKAEIQNIFFNMKPDDENYDYWEEQWRAISEATNEAQETLLSKTEEWAESMKAVIENNLTAAADNLENLLTGDTSFNEMMTELERLNERQEEFLTKTNQVYETNKMIRTAQSAIDKTDNIAAKTKLNNFVKETEALQEKNQLSSYELELQQSKYDLLLAEIALAEAQNAKSTVRLSRDDEGNFGYVYTADQDAIDKAEQEVEDAENALYNKSLEGINEYTEKYTQAKRDMYDELTELQNQYLNGEIASEEEYNRLKEQILEHYLGQNGILTQYQDLYRIAVSANSAAAEEAWNDDYIDMTEDVEDLKDAVDEYLKDVDEDFVTWQTVSTAANTAVKGALDDSKTATDNLTTASDTLRKEIEDELLPALQSEYDMVWAEVEAYAAKRTEVKGLIQDYLNYINTLNSVIAAEARKEAEDTTTDTTNTSTGEDDSGAGDTGIQEGQTGGTYTVKTGDTLWGIAKAVYGSGAKWVDLLIKNGFIEENERAKYLTGKYNTNPGHWIFPGQILTYDTGGYTGAWGPEGKLAMLHQKELILNAQDTENMLGIIMAVREIMNSIDKQATWASNGLGMLTAAGYNSMSQNLEQTVTIHAEFPNATNHNEIEEAFNTLINRASQYANRR